MKRGILYVFPYRKKIKLLGRMFQLEGFAKKTRLSVLKRKLKRLYFRDSPLIANETVKPALYWTDSTFLWIKLMGSWVITKATS